MWKKKEKRRTWASLEEPKLDGPSSPQNKLEAEVSNLGFVGQTVVLKEVDESYRSWLTSESDIERRALIDPNYHLKKS